jgi:hypothetical protein
MNEAYPKPAFYHCKIKIRVPYKVYFLVKTFVHKASRFVREDSNSGPVNEWQAPRANNNKKKKMDIIDRGTGKKETII